MSQYLIYVDATDLSIIDDAFEVGIDNQTINEYFTLTEDGRPIVFEKGMVSDPDFCNGMAIRCAMLTEANTDVIPKANIKNWLGSDIQDSKLILELLDDLINGRYTIENFRLDVSEYGDN